MVWKVPLLKLVPDAYIEAIGMTYLRNGLQHVLLFRASPVSADSQYTGWHHERDV